MSRCQCEAIEDVFDKGHAEWLLDRMERRGPEKTTRLLLEAIRASGVSGRTLLDVGGGVGTIAYELFSAGLLHATDVDASGAFLRAARKEARRRAVADRMTFHHGNFVELAPSLPAADIVTLDRVICCYDDAPSLVASSAEKARLLYGVVYPRDAWWSRLASWCMNFFRMLRRDPFRVFVHPTREVESLLAARGFTRRYHRVRGLWQVAVFTRGAA